MYQAGYTLKTVILILKGFHNGTMFFDEHINEGSWNLSMVYISKESTKNIWAYLTTQNNKQYPFKSKCIVY